MPYIYRYIDLQKEEVCYVGKVTTYDDNRYETGLGKRHAQHKREEWYKKIGDENLLLQYIQLGNHTDADIFETWLIQYYDTGQLYNIAKTGWGKSSIDLYSCIFGRWRNFRENAFNNENEIYSQLLYVAEALWKNTEGLCLNVDYALESFCERVKEIQSDLQKAHRISRFDMQEDYKREDKEQPKPEEKD